ALKMLPRNCRMESSTNSSACITTCAGTAYRPPIAALTSLVATSQILFGSDNPFIPLAETAEGLKHLGFSEADLQQIGRDNAIELLPRLRSWQDPSSKLSING